MPENGILDLPKLQGVTEAKKKFKKNLKKTRQHPKRNWAHHPRIRQHSSTREIKGWLRNHLHKKVH